MKRTKLHAREHQALKALSNRGRRRVYDAILAAPGETVTTLVKSTGFKQPRVSHCLHYLERAELVMLIREGTEVRCYPAPGGIRAVLNYAIRSAAAVEKFHLKFRRRA